MDAVATFAGSPVRLGGTVIAAVVGIGALVAGAWVGGIFLLAAAIMALLGLLVGWAVQSGA